MFLTWNESKEKLEHLLHITNQQCTYLQVEWIISNQLHFLDILISTDHDDVILRTKVAHQLSIDPYSLPYIFGHARNNYRTLLRAALLRAVRCYINVFDFANELNDLQLSFQNNHFSNDFISYKILSFLEEFNVSQLKIYHGEEYYDQRLYERLRRKVIQYQRRQSTLKKQRYRQTIRRRARQLNVPRHATANNYELH